MRGKLIDGPALQTSDGKIVRLAGDPDTMGVLKDKRMKDADLEARGALTAPGQFTIEPIHTRALFVHKGGKRLVVTYWCDVCAIRTYTPGKCWCCQEETALDLRDPDTVEKK